MKEESLRDLIKKLLLYKNVFVYLSSLCWQHGICLVLPLCWLHRVMDCFIRSLFLPTKNSFSCRWLCFPTQFRECSHFRNTMQVRLSYFFIFLFQWVLCSEIGYGDQILFNILGLKTVGL